MFEPDDTLKQEVKKYKKLTIIFVIISIVLACLLVFSFLNVKQINVEKEQSIVLQEELQENWIPFYLNMKTLNNHTEI